MGPFNGFLKGAAILVALSSAFILAGCQGASFSQAGSGASASQNNSNGTDSNSGSGGPGDNGGSNNGGKNTTIDTVSQQYYFGNGVSLFNADGTANGSAQSQCESNIASSINYIVSANNDGASIDATCVFPDQTLAEEASESEWLDYVIQAFVNYPPAGTVVGAGPTFTFIDTRSQTMAACQAEEQMLGGTNPFSVYPSYYLDLAPNVSMSCVSNNSGGYTLTITVNTSQYESAGT